MKTINDFSFKNETALIRVDFNVPLDKDFNITDDTRIRASIPTLKKILGDGGSVILMSHLGRPKDGPAEKYSLKHLAHHLSDLLSRPVLFSDDCIGEKTIRLANALKPGNVLLLENLRFHKEEEMGDMGFAKQLASLGTVYVNDAFGTAHRAHASTSVIAGFFPEKKYFGFVMADEIENANRVLNMPEKPFTAIMGGAKVSDKILLIEQLMKKVDTLIIAGGMAFTFIKALGGKIGASLVEEDKLSLALHLLQKAKDTGVKIYLPVDAIIADRFESNANSKTVDINSIPDGWMGLDIGPGSEEIFSEIIRKSKTILWNGPAGVFEFDKFSHGTLSIAKNIADATLHGAFSLIGGGDSAAAINKFNLAEKVSYVSTGGGALLEYMEGKTLPGIDAIINQ